MHSRDDGMARPCQPGHVHQISGVTSVDAVPVTKSSAAKTYPTQVELVGPSFFSRRLHATLGDPLDGVRNLHRTSGAEFKTTMQTVR